MNLQDGLTTFFSYLKQAKKRYLIKLAYNLKSKTGLEIGGPSSIFGLKGYFPVYLFASQIDGVNFSTETVWEGTISEGKNYQYYTKKEGYQYVTEASDLGIIPAEKYDFILSCHSLEHMANPIKALQEWKRVIKRGSTFILVLPDKENTFDHKRPYTTFEHLLNDYKNETGELDETHFDEVIKLHDIDMDKGLNSVAELEIRTKANFVNRCVHHHVFSLEVIKEMLEFSGFEVKYQQKGDPFHLITVAIKK